MRPTTNKILSIVLALTVMGALVYAFVPQSVAVDLATIQRGALMVTVEEEGRTRIRERYVVTEGGPGAATPNRD